MVAAWIYDEWWQRSIAGSSVSQVVDLLRTHLEPNHIPLTLIASLDTLPVGPATLLAHDVGTEQWSHLSPWLAAVYVVPEYRRRGFGAVARQRYRLGGGRGRDGRPLSPDHRARRVLYALLGCREVFDRAGKATVMSHVAAAPG